MKLNVLIIEDDIIVAMHIEKSVQQFGHHVVGVARSADEAFKIAENNTIDLVLSDIQIEGNIDGIECSKKLRSLYAVPVIIISAYNDMQTLMNATSLEFAGYLIKPFREEELKTLLDLIVIRQKNGMVVKKEFIGNGYEYSIEHQTLYFHGEIMELTQKEHQFLKALLKSNGAILSYVQFANYIWDGEDVSDEARRQLVYRFKQKLPEFPLKLIKGIGYKLESRRAIH